MGVRNGRRQPRLCQIPAPFGNHRLLLHQTPFAGRFGLPRVPERCFVIDPIHSSGLATWTWLHAAASTLRLELLTSSDEGRCEAMAIAQPDPDLAAALNNLGGEVDVCLPKSLPFPAHYFRRHR